MFTLHSYICFFPCLFKLSLRFDDELLFRTLSVFYLFWNNLGKIVSNNKESNFSCTEIKCKSNCNICFISMLICCLALLECFNFKSTVIFSFIFLSFSNLRFCKEVNRLLSKNLNVFRSMVDTMSSCFKKYLKI